MFAHTVSLWRRLIGSRPRQSPSGLESDDRRVWVRFPADVAATYQPAGTPDAARFSAVVRNISVGGLNLAVDRLFTPGNLLTVELPGPTEESTYTVLACVVYVAAVGEKCWHLGCTFARELNNDDLEPFGARCLRPQDADQRTCVRYTCDVKATYQLVAAVDAGEWPAKVLNISARGVGLLVNRAIEAGTLLSVDLLSPTGQSGKTMLSCVVHVTHQSEGESALGCNFITELSERDLNALL